MTETNTLHPIHSIYSVFDGHGGHQVSQLLSETLPHAVGARICQQPAAGSRGDGRNDLFSPLAAAFKEADDLNLSTDFSASGSADPGSTAVVAVLSARRLVVANVGNSRAFLCSGPPTDGKISADQVRGENHRL